MKVTIRFCFVEIYSLQKHFWYVINLIITLLHPLSFMYLNFDYNFLRLCWMWAYGIYSLNNIFDSLKRFGVNYIYFLLFYYLKFSRTWCFNAICEFQLSIYVKNFLVRKTNKAMFYFVLKNLSGERITFNTLVNSLAVNLQNIKDVNESVSQGLNGRFEKNSLFLNKYTRWTYSHSLITKR